MITIARSAEEWQRKLGDRDERTVVTVGNFDGVHLGHQKILRAVAGRYTNQAGARRLMPAVLTFYPHPAHIVRPEKPPALLMTLAQRLAAIEKLGIHAALVLTFDRELSEVGPEDFARRYLVETLRAQAVFVGENFRFGHRQAGDVNLLRELGKRWDFEVEVIPPVVIRGVVVSSTAIRQALREGRVEDAHKLLRRPYALAGEIRPGTGQGRKLVVPTVNLATEQELLPKNGVYATEVLLDEKLYEAATNVGMRPTFDGTETTVESHLLGFGENRTSGPMEVRFLTRLRDEQKFPNPRELREQVLRDIERAREYFRISKTARD
jgi:riboflavin kinase / FMN adenylyltransferase